MKITTSHAHGFDVGDKITIAGIYNLALDRRLWPRLRNWMLRKPPPLRKAGLKVFEVTESNGTEASLRDVNSLHSGK